MRLLEELGKRFPGFVTKLGGFPLLFLLVSSAPFASEKMFCLQIGPAWPSKTSTAWDAEVMYGLFIDKKVGFGVAADFLWNTYTQERLVVGGQPGQMETVKDESSYMFPVMGYVVFDPLPYQIIHPMLKFSIGYNSLKYNLNYKAPPAVITEHSGYYYGLIVKLGADGLYNLGEQAAVFLGLEYQWADTKSTENNEGFFWRRDMSGAGIHIGFRFLL